MVKKEETAYVCFEYENEEYIFEIDNHGISTFSDIEEKRVCGSDNPDCDHDEFHCMVIKGFVKNEFYFDKYCDVFLTLKTNEENDDVERDLSSIKKLVTAAISQIDILQYIDCHPEPDYYGEILITNANIKAITERVVEKLSEHFKKVRVN